MDFCDKQSTFNSCDECTQGYVLENQKCVLRLANCNS